LLYVTIRFIAYTKYKADYKGSTDGMQELAYRASPDNIIAGRHREYSHATLKPQMINSHVDRLF
jgi:hypothetical protein